MVNNDCTKLSGDDCTQLTKQQIKFYFIIIFLYNLHSKESRKNNTGKKALKKCEISISFYK